MREAQAAHERLKLLMAPTLSHEMLAFDNLCEELLAPPEKSHGQPDDDDLDVLEESAQASRRFLLPPDAGSRAGPRDAGSTARARAIVAAWTPTEGEEVARCSRLRPVSGPDLPRRRGGPCEQRANKCCPGATKTASFRPRANALGIPKEPA